jgi:hypothetical protein
MKKSVVVAAALAASVCAVSGTFAGDLPTDRAWDAARALQSSGYRLDKYQVSMEPDFSQPYQAASTDNAKPASKSEPVLFLDAAPSTSKIHGFLDFRFATGYLTPRGLQVENSGLVMQPLAGLVFDLYSGGTSGINSVAFIMGIWSSVHTNHPGGDMWNECDIFAGVSVKFLDKWTFDGTVMAWFFPDISTKAEANPQTEYNVEFKFSYDDTEYLKEWALHPYVSIFWNFEGDSPVVLGTTTFYAEIGVNPSFTLKPMESMPVTISFPAYFQFGDSSFWGEAPNGDRSNIGLFSVGTKISVPLNFIPKEYGSWSAYVGFTYIHTCNEALTEASHIVGSGYTHERYLGYAGIGMGF